MEFDAAKVIGNVIKIRAPVKMTIDAICHVMLFHDFQHTGRISLFIIRWIVHDGKYFLCV